MTTILVPTWVEYPAWGPTLAARGVKFMLPGYDGSQGGVPWEPELQDDIGDVLHYWFRHYDPGYQTGLAPGYRRLYSLTGRATNGSSTITLAAGDVPLSFFVGKYLRKHSSNPFYVATGTATNPYVASATATTLTITNGPGGPLLGAKVAGGTAATFTGTFFLDSWHTPMSNMDLNSTVRNIIQWQPGALEYVCDFGWKWGGPDNLVAGQTNGIIIGDYRMIDGTIMQNVVWPTAATHYSRCIDIDVNGGRLSQVSNVAQTTPDASLPGVLVRGSTQVSVPSLPAVPASFVSASADPQARFNEFWMGVSALLSAQIPDWDWAVGGDGGGWVFSGTVDGRAQLVGETPEDALVRQSTITDIVAKYATRPFSADWNFHLLGDKHPIVFQSGGTIGRIVNVDEGARTCRIMRSDGAAFLPSLSTGRYEMALDGDGAWSGGKPRIVSISPVEYDAVGPRVLTLNKASQYNWGTGATGGPPSTSAIPYAPIKRALGVQDARRKQIIMMDFRYSSHCGIFTSVEGGSVHHGRPPNIGSAFVIGSEYEDWYMFFFSQCDHPRLGHPDDGTPRLKFYGAWSDFANWSGIPWDTLITHVDLLQELNAGGLTYGACTGRQLFVPEGYSGIVIEDSNFQIPSRWAMDIEDGDVCIDAIVRRCTFTLAGGQFGFSHLRPKVTDTTPAPNFLTGCHTDEDSDIVTILGNTTIDPRVPGASGWPINEKDVHRWDNFSAQPAYSRTYLTDDIYGAHLVGPGIAPFTYVKKKLNFNQVQISKPATLTQDGALLFRGDTTGFKGLHFEDVHVNGTMDLIWSDGIGDGRGECWFQASVDANNPRVLYDIVMAPRADTGEIPPTSMIKVGTAGGQRTFCIFNNVTNPTSKRAIVTQFLSPTSVLLSADCVAKSFQSQATKRYWFFTETWDTWMSDFKVKRCSGTGLWGGAHPSTQASATPLILVPRLSYDVEIVENNNPTRLKAGAPRAGAEVEIMVGTTKSFSPDPGTGNPNPQNIDDPMYRRSPPYTLVNRPGPKQSYLGPDLIPNGEVSTGWTVRDNYWPNALDNQVASSLAVWLHPLELDATLTAAGQVSPVVRPPQYFTAPGADVTITGHMLAGASQVAPGTMRFFLDFQEIANVALDGTTDNEASFVIPAALLPDERVYVLHATYDGGILAGNFFQPGSYFDIPPGAPTLNPHWSTLELTVGTPPTPAVPDITINVAPNPALSNQAVAVSGALESNFPGGGHEPTSIQILTDTGGLLATVPVVGGVYTYTQVFGAGSYQVQAFFPGDPWNTSIWSSAVHLVVTDPTSYPITVGVVKTQS